MWENGNQFVISGVLLGELPTKYYQTHGALNITLSTIFLLIK